MTSHKIEHVLLIADQRMNFSHLWKYDFYILKLTVKIQYKFDYYYAFSFT